MIVLRRLLPQDAPRLRQFWQEHWLGAILIVHGQAFCPEDVEGFTNDDWTGVVTYHIDQHGCEIVSLDSLREGMGVATGLLQAVADEARRSGCTRLFLSTTNDNLHALGFYQRRGFELARLRRGAVAESRKSKPDIPLIAANGIPIRDEIELELHLDAAAGAGA